MKTTLEQAEEFNGLAKSLGFVKQNCPNTAEETLALIAWLKKQIVDEKEMIR